MTVAQNTNFNLVITDARLQSSSDAQLAKKQGGSVLFENIPRSGAVDRNGDGKIDQLQMQMDTKAVKTAHDDPSGVTTTSHALHHATAVMNSGSYDAGLLGDQPTSASGPAAQFGKGVAAESPDISKKEAKKIVEENIKR